MVDFSELLNVEANKVERPPAKPVGTYVLRVTKTPEQIESREKKTPGLQFTFAYVEALADVDPELLENVDLSKGTIRDTFWITEDSLYRLKEFYEKAGADIESKTFKELVPESANMEVLAHVVQVPGRDSMFNQIDSYASITERDKIGLEED